MIAVACTQFIATAAPNSIQHQGLWIGMTGRNKHGVSLRGHRSGPTRIDGSGASERLGMIGGRGSRRHDSRPRPPTFLAAYKADAGKHRLNRTLKKQRDG